MQDDCQNAQHNGVKSPNVLCRYLSGLPGGSCCIFQVGHRMIEFGTRYPFVVQTTDARDMYTSMALPQGP